MDHMQAITEAIEELVRRYNKEYDDDDNPPDLNFIASCYLEELEARENVLHYVREYGFAKVKRWIREREELWEKDPVLQKMIDKE